MGGSKLDTPEVKKHVVQRLAAGATKTDVAKEVQIDRASISRFSQRDDIKALVEAEAIRLTEILPDAIQAVIDTVKSYRDIPDDEMRRKEFAYKVIRDVLKAVKIFPTPLQSQTFINIQQGDSEACSPEVMELLKFHTEQNVDILDIDPEIPGEEREAEITE